MRQALADRITYGRAIRERADCLLVAHGRAALAHARMAARVATAPEAERNFWEAVAARVLRLSSEPRWDPVF
jgi:hypothetical protein